MTNQLQCMSHTTTAWTVSQCSSGCMLNAVPDSCNTNTHCSSTRCSTAAGPSFRGSTACQKSTACLTLTILHKRMRHARRSGLGWWRWVALQPLRTTCMAPRQPHGRQGSPVSGALGLTPIHGVPLRDLLKLWLHWHTMLRSHRATRLSLLLQLTLAHECRRM
jgi:hypothetical protein